MKKATVIFFLTFFICHFYRYSFSETIKFNAYNQKYYTSESDHFRIHFPENLRHVAEEIVEILERLYITYKNTYNLTLPSKTEVLVSNDDRGGGWAIAIKNTIHIWANDFDWNLRGTTNWLENVVAHEYAHIVSISTSFKTPPWIPYIQYGYFSHPNEKRRIEAFHLFPSEILPPWFFEGIAQFESSRNKGDSWDSHRDMILRTLTLSDKLLSWEHMSVFTGKGDDYEKSYNHGFSLIGYIDQTYGYGSVVSILREASKFGRVNFDRAIKASLGISGKALYKEWKGYLKKRYAAQIDSLGKQWYGKKINRDGFDNFWPRFGPDDKKIYFLSNGKHDFAIRGLYAYALSDTVAASKRITLEKPYINDFYDIDAQSSRIVFSNRMGKKSTLPSARGGYRTRDVYIDTLASPQKRKIFAKKTFRQITEKESIFDAVFSPQGDMLACTKHVYDEFYLCLVDTSGTSVEYLYPPKNDAAQKIKSIYSLDWSSDGRRIAMSYLDKNDRKIGIYDIAQKKFHTICDTRYDERDPRFSPDGTKLYFSSDRTGIFNIYRYDFDSGILQRLTNVSGGAFTPDVSSDEKKLVFANYDPAGYGIYLIDSIKIIDETRLDRSAAVVQRTGNLPNPQRALLTPPKRYSSIPRQALFIPTFFVEQILSTDNDAFKGINHFKLGAVFNLVDPLFWMDKGTALGGLFLLSPENFIFTSGEIINRKATYDLGLFGYSNKLPVDISLFYFQRAIAGTDVFGYDGFTGLEDSVATLDYNLNPSFIDLTITHKFNDLFHLNFLASYNQYKVWVKTASIPPYYDKYFNYVPTKGFRIGSYLTYTKLFPDSKTNISPKITACKIKYEFWNQWMQNEIKSFTWDGSSVQENYIAPYRYHQLTTSIIAGKPAPWYKKHDIYTQLDFTGVRLFDASKKKLQNDFNDGHIPSTDIPSYMQPEAWIPGYCYYYKDTIKTILKDINSSLPPETTSLYTDTVLVSGNGVFTGSISYRFPLFPGSIDKKLSFIYLDKVYGAINFGGGTAVNKLADIKTLRRDDLLLFCGAELRLESISFNSFPLALSTRWNWGFDRKAPIGGHKFTMAIGFNFDNWEIIVEPDGRQFLPRPFIRR